MPMPPQSSPGPATRTTGRPPRFSVDQVIEAALKLGVNTFTMPRVAAMLGVTTPALYRHFPSRDDLVTACLTKIFAGTARLAEGSTWREALEHVAEASWRAFSEYPGLDVVVTTFPRPLRSIFPVPGDVLVAFTGAGFTDRQTVSALDTVTNLTTAAVSLLHRQLAELSRLSEGTGQRMFVSGGTRVLTDADTLTECARAQWRFNIDFFLERMEAVAPDWPSYLGPLADPGTENHR